MDNIMWMVLGGCVCGLLGSIPFGFLAGKLKGVDVRKSGSGNIGATNVFRVLGKSWGIGVFILDALKGLLGVTIASFICPVPWYLMLMGIVVVLGHNYTPFLKFKGGKGVATSAGVLLAIMPYELILALLTWITVFWTTRVVSIASLLASVILPIAALAKWYLFGVFDEWIYVLMACLLGGLSIWRHRSNIRRLIEGNELGFKK